MTLTPLMVDSIDFVVRLGMGHVIFPWWIVDSYI